MSKLMYNNTNLLLALGGEGNLNGNYDVLSGYTLITEPGDEYSVINELDEERVWLRIPKDKVDFKKLYIVHVQETALEDTNVEDLSKTNTNAYYFRILPVISPSYNGIVLYA